MPERYSYNELKKLWVKAGGDPDKADVAASVALAESGGRPGAVNTANTDRSTDRGLWQINTVHGKLSTTDPLANAKAAVKISNEGKNWSPWVAYKSGAYRKFYRGKGESSDGGGHKETPKPGKPKPPPDKHRPPKRETPSKGTHKKKVVKRKPKKDWFEELLTDWRFIVGLIILLIVLVMK